MKRVISAAILFGAITTVAHAQSSVTLYGIVDAGISYISNTQGKSAFIEDTGVAQASRWGLKGTEDLGGGLSALFQLESGINIGTGQLAAAGGGALFGRMAFVGLSSQRFGTVTLGRQYDFMVQNLVLDTAAARFGTVYGFHPLDVDRLAGESLDNAVQYLSKPIAGVTAGAMYGFSNVPGAFAGTSGSPRFTSFGLNYDASGPLVLGAAYTSVNGAGGSVAEVAFGAKAMRNFGFGARYRFGPLTVFGNYTNNLASGIAHNGSILVQVGEIGFDDFITPFLDAGLSYIYNRYPNGALTQVDAGARYFLSKRTNLYFSANFVRSNSPKALPAGLFVVVNPGTNTGYSTSANQVIISAGLRTTF